jgi:hypothetical protein
MGVSGQRHAPASLYPPVPIVQEAGWAPEPVWTEARGKIPCRGSNLDRPVVQSVARHYTDWATPAPNYSFWTTKLVSPSLRRIFLPRRTRAHIWRHVFTWTWLRSRIFRRQGLINGLFAILSRVVRSPLLVLLRGFSPKNIISFWMKWGEVFRWKILSQHVMWWK